MRLDRTGLGRATLARQLLLERADASVPDAVRRVGALQAQEPAGPYLALWNRVAGFRPDDLDAAFASGTVVRATLMRVTLHAVHQDDWAAFHHAMTHPLRGSRLNDRRFAPARLTPAEADEVRDAVLAFADRPRTQDEIVTELSRLLDDERAPATWFALRTLAPLHHVPSGAPWSFSPRERVYRAGARTAANEPPAGDDPAVVHLLRRYLAAFGPATEADFARFTMLRKPWTGPAVETLRPELVEIDGPDGVTLLDLPDAPRPAADTPAPPRLLGMWDSLLLAHADRTRVVPEALRGHVVRRNGDTLATVLVDGRVTGFWRATDDGIDAAVVEPLPDRVWSALAAEAASLQELLADREPAVFRRYRRWWDELPAVEVRRLADARDAAVR
ncbi:MULTISPECIES: winged helix DNA-binding domain-containing protein [unclassified Isoptericola]|uniref:winged helix DNA-binding domain-containing protein n=1 Tax=unclassified Isoptericola TaxID=2623355 RepID=UPI002712AA64|nr:MULTISPECIES: winged helix DNA-binding domain-containing protein [unclassified Isoptericola]MDO8145857.1 winged helix DNA-binding domain-containing protein [Isoptericola sp. 178]MDO8147809.1 winged helix DNA-binding domain-containing protein [Isoptericola sp. b515]